MRCIQATQAILSGPIFHRTLPDGGEKKSELRQILPYLGGEVMSKKSRRPNREARKQHKDAVNQVRKELREQQKAEGVYERTESVSNALSPCQTVEEEQALRERAVDAQLSSFRSLLPKLLKDLAKIPDPRNPKKSKHKLTVILLYGLLAFVFQMASRREANRTLSRPAFLQTLRRLFPTLESLPHTDTLHSMFKLEFTYILMVRAILNDFS